MAHRAADSGGKDGMTLVDGRVELSHGEHNLHMYTHIHRGYTCKGSRLLILGIIKSTEEFRSETQNRESWRPF